MNKTYGVYLCRNTTEQKSVLLQIYEAIARREAALLSGLAADGDKFAVNRPPPHIKHHDISDDDVLKFRRPNQFAPVKP